MSTDDERPLTRRELRERREAGGAVPREGADGHAPSARRDDTGGAPSTNASVPDVVEDDGVGSGPNGAAAPRPGSGAADGGSGRPSAAGHPRTVDRSPQNVAPRKPVRDASGPEAGTRRRRPGRFATALLAVLGALIVLGGGGAAASLAQGPRVSDVQVDPAAAISSSGTRVVLTTNQALATIDASQVTVTPDAPFTVDAAGRMVGVRFTIPLDDDTEYTIRIAGAESLGGGPASTLTTTFTTPAAQIYLLQRDDDGDDTIYRSDLSGENAVAVYSAETIDDFRASNDHLVISLSTRDGSTLVETDADGNDPQELPLPGDGTITGLQLSDRGEYVGYLYTDKNLTDTSGEASVLYTSSLRSPQDAPQPLSADDPPSIASWRFVPDSSSLLYVDFDGNLVVFDPSADDPEPQLLGTALLIDAVTRGTYTAFIERIDTAGAVQLDLTTGEETPTVEPTEDLGQLGSMLPVPGGGTVRKYVTLDAAGLPAAQTVVYVSDDGTPTSLFTTGTGDAQLQTCVSPSGRYVAVLEAPDLAQNPYDTAALQTVPRSLHTHIVEVDTGDEVSSLTGFDISWCTVGPWDGGTG